MLTCSKRKPWPGLSLLLPLACGLIGLAVLPPALADDEAMLRTLKVRGQGVVAIPTTIAQVRLGVEVQGKTAEVVQQEVAERSSAVVDLLRSRDVQNLQTTGVRLYPNYTYENRVRRLEGYRGSNLVSFEVATEQAGPLLDEAVTAGATRIDGVSFVASESAIATARQQALQEATKEAQEQADIVLTALELTQQEIVGVQINSVDTPTPIPLATNARLAQAESTPVIGGEQEVQASVILQIRY